MDTHTGYYQNLKKYCKTMPCPSGHQIDLDLKRTFPADNRCMKEEFLDKMKNIFFYPEYNGGVLSRYEFYSSEIAINYGR